jgi:hypothetical protein
MEAFATLLSGADEEFPAGEAPALGDEWESEVDAVEKGMISEEERRAISPFRGFLWQAVDENKLGPQVTVGEKRLLKKWKSSFVGA